MGTQCSTARCQKVPCAAGDGCVRVCDKVAEVDSSATPSRRAPGFAVDGFTAVHAGAVFESPHAALVCRHVAKALEMEQVHSGEPGSEQQSSENNTGALNGQWPPPHEGRSPSVRNSPGPTSGASVPDSQGAVYEGEMLAGMRHGEGILSWPDSRRYEGQFRSGLFHGLAVMDWPDGRRYIGKYESNQKHGEGVFEWPDGRRYDGQWANGKRHGRGRYVNARGESRLGTWAKDRPVHWEPVPKISESSVPKGSALRGVKAIPEHASHVEDRNGASGGA